jgi:hypothetical protein
MRCDGRNGKQHHGGDLMQRLRIAVLLGRIEKSQRRKGALVKNALLDWREKKTGCGHENNDVAFNTMTN